MSYSASIVNANTAPRSKRKKVTEKKTDPPETVVFLPVLNTLRGVACVGVMLFHFVGVTTNLFSDSVKGVAYVGSVGVHVFFVVSGIVIPMSLVMGRFTYSKFGRFMWKRVIRIEPPYLISVVLFACYGLFRFWLHEFIPAIGRGSYPVPDVPTILAHLGYLVPFKFALPYFENANWLNGAYWTLAIEFQYYLLVAACFPLIFNRSVLVRVPCLFTMILSSMILSNMFFAETSVGSHSGLVFRWLPYFVVGIAYAQRRLSYSSRFEYFLVVSMALVIITCNEGIGYVVVVISVLLLVAYAPNHRSRIGDYFGEISYSLYLLHNLLGLSFLNYVASQNVPLWIRVVAVLVAVAISILSAHVMCKLVEVPSKRASKAIRLAGCSAATNK